LIDALDEASRCEMAEREAVVADQMERIRLASQLGAEREAARAGREAMCVGCDDPIPEPRRLAVPGCLRCIECERAKCSRVRR
jgi:RNA polymerase-binding transcription factor DksA